MIREPAENVANIFFFSVTNPNNPCAMVCTFDDRSTNFGKIKSIQGAIKLVIVSNTMMGLDTGRITFAKIWKCPAPSILAASSRLLETVSI